MKKSIKKKAKKTKLKDFKSEKTGAVIYSLDIKKKHIKYNIDKRSNQNKFLESIELFGFTHLPSGFYKEGYGLAGAGIFILQALFDALGSEKIHLRIMKTGANRIRMLRSKNTVELVHKDLGAILTQLREIKRLKNEESRLITQNYLFKLYPDEIPEPAEKLLEYRKDQISEILSETGTDKLSDADIHSMVGLLPSLLDKYSGKLKNALRLKKIFISKRRTEEVYLSNLVKEFEQKLKRGGREQIWQTFLRENLLLFNNSYTHLIEKQKISLSGKIPDFMLINLYGFLDVYEIKTPKTNILKHDKSRNNYYWHDEMSTAISQVENYLEEINQNKLQLVREIERTEHIRIKAIKPRGYIIIGASSQLNADPKAEADFRLLSESLKNIQIILYDELLLSLKNFLSKLESESRDSV